MSIQDRLNSAKLIGQTIDQRLYITGLHDTPTGYLGHSGDYLVVNDGESGIHFTGIEKIAADLVDYGFTGESSTIPSYTDLPDVTENDGKIVASGCDLYHSCNGTWNKIGGESIPPPAEAPGCVTNLEEYNQYQEYKDDFLADNLGNTFDQMLNSNNDISNLIFDVCLFPESNLENERNTVVIDETTYKWGMFAGPQTINLSAEGYSDGQGNDCVFSEWTSSNANFGDSSSANTTVFVDTDLSITGSFECLIAPSQPSCDRVVLHLQPTAGETITDKSSDEHAITVVGDTTVDNTKTLFGEDTMHFDGNGDGVSVGDTSTFKFLHDASTDYTVECWVNFSTLSALVNPIIGTAGNSHTTGFSIYYAGSNNDNNEWRALIWRGSQDVPVARVDISDVPETNRWYHVAAVHTNNTLYFYIDGVLGGSSSGVNYSSNDCWRELRVGSAEAEAGDNRYSDCQIQDVRISKKAVYTSNFTPPTNLLANLCPEQPSCEDVALHLQPDTGETITDKSGNEHVITTVGDTVVDDTTTLFGGDTINFDGNGDYLTVNQTSTLNLGGNFTMEGWFYIKDQWGVNGVNCLVSQWTDNSECGTNWSLNIRQSTKNLEFARKTTSCTSGVVLTGGFEYNTWTHVAVVGETTENTIKMYVNGGQAQQSITDKDTRSENLTYPIYIGTRKFANNGDPMDFAGHIQDFRISKHVVYTSNFTPPTNLLNNPC